MWDPRPDNLSTQPVRCCSGPGPLTGTGPHCTVPYIGVPRLIIIPGFWPGAKNNRFHDCPKGTLPKWKRTWPDATSSIFLVSAMTDTRAKRDNSSKNPNLAAIRKRRPLADPGNLIFVRMVWQPGAQKSYLTGISLTCVWLFSRWIIDYGVQSSAITDIRAKRDNSSKSPNLAAIRKHRSLADPGTLITEQMVWQPGAQKSYVTRISVT